MCISSQMRRPLWIDVRRLSTCQRTGGLYHAWGEQVIVSGVTLRLVAPGGSEADAVPLLKQARRSGAGANYQFCEITLPAALGGTL